MATREEELRRRLGGTRGEAAAGAAGLGAARLIPPPLEEAAPLRQVTPQGPATLDPKQAKRLAAKRAAARGKASAELSGRKPAPRRTPPRAVPRESAGVGQAAEDLGRRAGQARSGFNRFVTGAAERASNLASRVPTLRGAARFGGRLAGGALRAFGHYVAAPLAITDIGADVARGYREGGARGAADALAGVDTPEERAVIDQGSITNFNPFDETPNPLMTRFSAAIAEQGKRFLNPGQSTLRELTRTYGGGTEPQPNVGTGPTQVGTGTSEAPAPDPQTEAATRALGGLDRRARTGESFAGAQVLPGTGAVQVRDAQGNLIPGRSRALDLRSRLGVRGQPATPAAGEGRDRFNLRRYLRNAERRGGLSPVGAGIALGARNAYSLERGSKRELETRRVESEIRKNELTGLARVATAQAAQAAAGLQREQFSEAQRKNLSDQLHRSLTTFAEADNSTRSALMSAAFSEMRAGSPAGEATARALASIQLREAASKGFFNPRTWLPRILGGVERGVYDKVVSFFKGDPSVDISGSFKGLHLEGGDIVDTKSGQTLADLGDLGDETTQQAFRTLLAADNPSHPVDTSHTQILGVRG